MEDPILNPETKNENPNRELTEQEQIQLMEALGEKCQPLLQAMANASDSGDPGTFFKNYEQVVTLFTPAQMLAQKQIVPPWFIPRTDIQLIIIHTQLALLTKVMAEAGVFKVAANNRKARESSGLLMPDGRPI